MPTVPLNTITGPSGARLPNIRFAEPSAAQAMSAVTSALSRNASEAGRPAQQIGQLIDMEQERLQTQLADRQSMGKLALTVAQTGQNIGANVYNGVMQMQESRANREAEDALSEFKLYGSRSMYGATDPVTGTRTPGTLESPFAPTTGGDTEPSGASLSTAEAVKRWHEQKGGKYEKMSARAREIFSQKAQPHIESMMRVAYVQDQENYQRYKVESDKIADEATKQSISDVSATFDPELSMEWTNRASMGAVETAMRKTAHLRSNPDEVDPQKAKWIHPDASGMYEFYRDQFTHAAVVQRVGAMSAMLSATDDQETRNAQIAAVEEFASSIKRGDGQNILSEDEIAAAKDQARKANDEAVGRLARRDQQNSQAALYLSARWLLHQDADAKRNLDALRPSIPPSVMAEIDKTSESLHYKREMANLDEAKASYVASIGTPNQQAMYDNMLLTAQGMSNARAKIQAPAFMAATDKEVATAGQNAMADYLEKVVYFGGEPGPDGSFRSYSDAKLTTLIANANIPFDRAKTLTEEIAKRQDRDPVIEQKVYDAIDRLIGSDIDQAFKLQDGIIEYETRTEKGRTMPAMDADAAIGELNTGDMRLRPGFAPGGWKQKERTVKLKAELVRNIAQDAYDWYRQQKVLSKPGPNGQRAEPADVEAYIRSRLMPENNEDARAWTEADIEARIQIGKDEREQMRLLILEQFSASQMTPATNP